eukprot:scaffold15897_cov17-Prasinocladus_malaysianus.AAC.1
MESESRRKDESDRRGLICVSICVQDKARGPAGRGLFGAHPAGPCMYVCGRYMQLRWTGSLLESACY